MGPRSLLRAEVDAQSSHALLTESFDEFLSDTERLPAATAVEVGCGDGRGTEVLYRGLRLRLPRMRLLAFDLDGAKLGRARLRPDLAGAPGLCLARGDLYALPLAAESVDFLLALNVFHWADRPLLLSEARRVLKTSGKAFLYDVLPLGLDAPRPRVWFSLRREQIAAAFGPR